MSADDLARQITDNTEAQSKAAHSAWDRTQANINVMLGQVTALGQAKMMDFFLHNAVSQSGVPMVSRETLEESLRGMLATQPEVLKTAESPPVAVPPVMNEVTAVRSWLAPLLVAASLSVGGVGLGYGLMSGSSLPDDTGQENYRYNYLEARGMHLPPPITADGD